MESKVIRISSETYKGLAKLGTFQDSFDSVIRNLLVLQEKTAGGQTHPLTPTHQSQKTPILYSTKQTKPGENPMNANYLYIKLKHKDYCFVRTESQFFEISEFKIPSDGPIVNAVPTPDSTVADLLEQEQRELLQQRKAKRRASKMKRLQKEEVKT